VVFDVQSSPHSNPGWPVDEYDVDKHSHDEQQWDNQQNYRDLLKFICIDIYKYNVYI
jgi:hypothetical protein